MQMWVATLVGDALEENTLTLLVSFFRMVRCVVLATGVCAWSDVWMRMRQEEYVKSVAIRSRWRSVVSAHPYGKKAWVYVWMYENLQNTHKLFSSYVYNAAHCTGAIDFILFTPAAWEPLFCLSDSYYAFLFVDCSWFNCGFLPLDLCLSVSSLTLVEQ